jgi:hypothetical protein
LKIGLPRLRLSRKLLVITLGVTVLLGGTAAAALYFKSKELGLERVETVIGGECTDVQTMVLKTPSNRLWLRRFIRMENASGPDRVRTALRVAGLLAKKNAVDLIHVSVLDSHGPTLRSQMRARSIGAEVLIAMKPDNLPEMKSPAMASYYEGPVNDEGRYYGDKVVIDIDEIGAMMTAMRSIEEKPDCVSPEAAKDAEAKPNDHGKKDEKSADHGKKEDHGAKPAEDHGAKPEETEGDKAAEDHGEQPAKDGAEDHAKTEAPAEEQSFFDSMLSMVGLGGGDEKPTAEPKPDMSHAVAEETPDAAADDHAEKPAGEHDVKEADHGEKPLTEGAEKSADAEDHAKPKDAAADDHGEKPATETEDHSAADTNGAKEDHGDDSAAAPDKDAMTVDKAHADQAPAEEEKAPATEKDAHGEPVKTNGDDHALADMPVGD